jgi:hypothetical protein
MSKKGTKVLEHERRTVKMEKGKKLPELRMEALKEFLPKGHAMLDNDVKGSFILIAMDYDKKGMPKGSKILTAIIGPDLESIDVMMALDSAKRNVLTSSLENLMEGVRPK